MIYTNENHWYDIPLEKLNLPVKGLNLLVRSGMMSVGDCIDCLEPHRFYGALIHFRWHPYTNSEFLKYVLPILIKEGFWQEEKAEPTPDDFHPIIIEEIRSQLFAKGYGTYLKK